jgi:hypothetical protein
MPHPMQSAHPAAPGVLLVDDSATIRYAIQNRLQRLGCQVDAWPMAPPHWPPSGAAYGLSCWIASA